MPSLAGPHPVIAARAAGLVERWSAAQPTPLPHYSHTQALIGGAIILVVIAVIALSTLITVRGRRGR